MPRYDLAEPLDHGQYGSVPDVMCADLIVIVVFVAVDEEGTEAAAATAVVANDDSAPEPAEIAFDRPFIFVIYDQPTGQILFVGHLRDPG